VTADLLMIVAIDDEMVCCNPTVARMTYDQARGHKEYHEIDGGHFGLLYHPRRAVRPGHAHRAGFHGAAPGPAQSG
jgi:hypothetical protein